MEYNGENKVFHPEKFSSTFLEKVKEITGGSFIILAYFNSSWLKPDITSAHGLNKKIGDERVILILDLGKGILMCLSSLQMIEYFISNLHLEKSTWVKKILTTQ